ncbi:MAG TPA: DUF4129 domain-containing protein [Pedobacter sp.]|uniref:DUF4129 domain-containing protein n=1 Tax=Pedobacter sp. TaxID=1411316 RepID=UPI002B665E55|nr:DUF4129 domain-containing protein [Pedobacter sp.]HMI03166.1 DUF4129 domain-containing protein [Pedobacter sp.]
MRKILFLFLLLCVSTSCFSFGTAQVPVKKGTVSKKLVVKNDSTKLTPRKFDQQKIRSYRLSKEFIYDNTAPENESLWSKFWKWFWELFERVAGNKHANSFIGYTALIVLASLIVFGVMKLLGLDLKILSGKSKQVEVPYHESSDNIHEIDFMAEIDKAISGGNYRLAVRLFYLRALKQLSDSGQISWQPEKTNQTYVSEIRDLQKRSLFETLTTQFEYIWYGEFYIDQENFNQVRSGFDQFNPNKP